jgi:hypothetical protein
MKRTSIVLVALLAICSLAGAATFTNVVGGTSGYSAARAGGVYVLENSVDFSVYPATTNDVFQLINIPANSYVKEVSWEVTTSCGTNSFTFDIGDAGDADGFISNASGDTVAQGASVLALTVTPTTGTFATNVTTTTTNLVYLTDTNGATATQSVVIAVAAQTSTAVASATATGTGYSEGKFYTAADTLDLTADKIAIVGKVYVRAVVSDLN